MGEHEDIRTYEYIYSLPVYNLTGAYYFLFVRWHSVKFVVGLWAWTDLAPQQPRQPLRFADSATHAICDFL
jgi:hypothetical protein